jgi:hypothetical protein
MANGVTEQAGAVLYRGKGASLEFLLVTTVSGAWSIPKGGIDLDETTAEAAEREAREEVGVEGRVVAEPLGEFTYTKFGGRYRVTVHLLKVERELDEWDEKGERERKWVAAAKAPEAAAYESVRELLRKAAKAL